MKKTPKYLVIILTSISCAIGFFVIAKQHLEILSEKLPREDWGARILNIKNRNPKEDLKKAIQANDLCFKGINGYSTLIPGVERYYPSLAGEKCVKIINDTSDAISSADSAVFQALAKQYATIYNTLLLKYIESQMPLQKYKDWQREKGKLDSAQRNRKNW